MILTKTKTPYFTQLRFSLLKLFNISLKRTSLFTFSLTGISLQPSRKKCTEWLKEQQTSILDLV